MFHLLTTAICNPGLGEPQILHLINQLEQLIRRLTRLTWLIECEFGADFKGKTKTNRAYGSPGRGL